MSNGTKAEITTFWRENDEATPVFEEVGDVYGMSNLNKTRDVSDSVPYGTGGNKKRKDADGQIDFGNQTFELRFKFDNAQANAMEDDFKATTQPDRRYQLRIGDANKSLVVMTSQISSIEKTFEPGYIMLKFTLEHNDVDESGVWT